MIGITFFASFAVLIILSTLCKTLGEECIILRKVHRGVLFTTWVFYILLHAYYTGALTMFFSTEVEVPFFSIKDAMSAYPNWRLMMRWGNEAYYIDYVDIGDSEYIKFWDRVKRKPAETVFRSIEEVMQKHKDDPVIIHDLLGSIDIYS